VRCDGPLGYTRGAEMLTFSALNTATQLPPTAKKFGDETIALDTTSVDAVVPRTRAVPAATSNSGLSITTSSPASMLIANLDGVPRTISRYRWLLQFADVRSM